MSAFRTASRSAGADAGRPPCGAQGRPRRIRGVAARATNDLERAVQAPSRAVLNPGRRPSSRRPGRTPRGVRVRRGRRPCSDTRRSQARTSSRASTVVE